MNTLQTYDAMVRLVSQVNALAVKLRRDETTKVAAMEAYKDILVKALEKIG